MKENNLLTDLLLAGYFVLLGPLAQVVLLFHYTEISSLGLFIQLFTFPVGLAASLAVYKGLLFVVFLFRMNKKNSQPYTSLGFVALPITALTWLMFALWLSIFHFSVEAWIVYGGMGIINGLLLSILIWRGYLKTLSNTDRSDIY